MADCISREEAFRYIIDNQCISCYEIGGCGKCGVLSALKLLRNAPAADVVPWAWLERYAYYFCAGVSMPEFVKEAKMFYESTNKAMRGGVIDG